MKTSDKAVQHLAVERGKKYANRKASEMRLHIKRITKLSARHGWTVNVIPCAMRSGAGQGWSYFGELEVVIQILDSPNHIMATAILETSCCGIGFRPEIQTGPAWCNRRYDACHHSAGRADAWLRRVIETSAEARRLCSPELWRETSPGPFRRFERV